jgi:putative inorganic carbon (hco3(-)) transporter
MSRSVLLCGLAAAIVLGIVLETHAHIPPLVIAMIGVVGVVSLLLGGLLRPEIPLYVLAAYLPFSKQLPGDFGGAATALNLTNLLFFSVIVASAFDCVTRRRPMMEFYPLHIMVVLMAAWGCLSFIITALSPDSPPEYALDHVNNLKRWLDPFLVYFLFFQGVRRVDVWRNVVGIVMVVVAVVAGLAVYDYIGIAGSSLDKSRVAGVVGQPNYLGAFFVYYMFLYAGHWIENRRRPRAWLLLLPFALCFRGIMVTFSRGAYLAFALGVLGLAFFKKRILAVVAVAALALVALNPWMLPAGIRYRLDMTTGHRSEPLDEYNSVSVDDLDASSAGRLVIWQGGLEMVKAHPFLGVGFGRFPELITSYVTVDLKTVRDAHNTYMITVAELGLPGLALLLTTLASLFWVGNSVLRCHPDPFVHATALGFLGGLSGLLLANMFGSRLNTTEVASYLWILAALLARADLEFGRQLAGRRASAPSR